MKAWKRGVTLLAALALSLGLCACGTSTPSGVQQPSSEQQTPAPAVEEPGPEEPLPEEITEPEPEPEPVPLTGLIVANADFVNKRGTINIPVYCIDPDTGMETQISDFNVVQNIEQDGSYLSIGGVGLMPLRYFHYYVSQDCTKLAGTKYFTAGGRHAGWFDTNGMFFDAIEALGLEAKSDFDDPVRYLSVGFSENYFIFYDSTAEKYYSVPVDNMTPANVQEGDIRCAGHPYEEGSDMVLRIPNNSTDLKFYASNVTSWIDDTRCIINNRDGITQILDMEAKTVSNYVPGQSRINWNGFASPDGSRIAFMSEPDTHSATATDIYTIPVSGGEPVKVTGYSVSLASCRAYSGIMGTYVLIGWR